jgi:hypothetical protein
MGGGVVQGCQICFVATYQNVKLYTKPLQNIPNGHKTHQVALQIPNSHKTYHYFLFRGLQKYTKMVILVFRFVIWQPWCGAKVEEGETNRLQTFSRNRWKQKQKNLRRRGRI